MGATDDLLDDIFAGRRPALYLEFEGWLRGSRRFRAFAGEHRAKIRAKLKNAPDEAGLQDVRAELETAALLLGDRRFSLEYEKYVASKGRGPDFTVTYKTHTPFNVEVRRLRRAELEGVDGEATTGKFMALLVDKVGQMPPSIVNLLWLTAEGELAEADLTAAASALRHLAERKEEAYFRRRGFKSAADFLKQYSRLSGIVAPKGSEIQVWQNPLARHKARPEIVTALRRLAAI
ncbi:MAG: hypothetical protein ACRDHL_09120 [Candidatus Promineifilaceae bacterium]